MIRIILFVIVALLWQNPAIGADFSAVLAKIKLKPGFKISIFGEMPKPRQIEVGKLNNPKSPNGPNSVVFIGSRHGHIYSMVDTNRDGVGDEVRERMNGLNVPNGVAIQDSMLYIALQDKIVKWPIPAELDSVLPLQPLIAIKEGLHNDFWHGWRYIDFGPDRKLYVTIGSPCNICENEEDTGKIFRIDADGSNWEVVAAGVRNSVGFDWHPKTKELWFTDNGADGMGDNIPADELNRVTRLGQHFGFPYLGGKSEKLPGFEDKVPPMELTPPEIEFGAHTANLGIDFYTGNMFPAEYKNDAFVVQHGSWNRTEPIGYRIMRVRFDDDGNALGKEVFADGWLADGLVIGRPVDIEELPDGSILVSDDFANVIYRIAYEK